SRAPSLAALLVITWRLRLTTVMAGVWSVVAEAVVRACLTVLVSFECSCGVWFASSSVRTPPLTSGPSSGRHRGCHSPTRSRLGQSERNARAQRAELAAPPLLSFLHLGPNSAYVSSGYRQSG